MSASSEVDGKFGFTTPVQLLHPTLASPRKFKSKKNNKESGEPKFQATFMFPADSEDLKRAKAIAAAIAKENWPGRDLRELKFPLTNGTTLADAKEKETGKDTYGYTRGTVLLKSASGEEYPPKLSVYDKTRREFVELDRDNPNDVRLISKKFFFGAEVVASLRFKAYDGVGQNPDGVTAYVAFIGATGGGKQLGSSGDPNQVFKGYVGEATTDDPTKGLADLDDEIPF